VSDVVNSGGDDSSELLKGREVIQETREVEQDVQCLCHVGGMILVVVNGLRQVEVFSPNEEFDELRLFTGGKLLYKSRSLMMR
jgi:hypothetical protein